ncbi:MAG: mechanosensitive ion channel domain-containing protein [Nanoarchaeota archaeon]
MAGGVVETTGYFIQEAAVGIVILLVGFGLGVLAKKFLYKILQETTLNKAMSRMSITADMEKIISSVVSYVIYLVTIIIFLDYLSIRSVVLYLLAGAVLALLVATIVLGLKDIIPNLIAWLILQKNGSLEEGRTVEVREISGVIKRTGCLETEIKTNRGDILHVPNAFFLKHKFKILKIKVRGKN